MRVEIDKGSGGKVRGWRGCGLLVCVEGFGVLFFLLKLLLRVAS